MQDQRPIWERNYARAREFALGEASEFAIEVGNRLNVSSSILELGCGAGVDANYFASAGHRVKAVDFSSAAIDAAREQFPSSVDPPVLVFVVHDISSRLPFDDAMFDLVYARLSLHYFLDDVTRAIFKDIARVLTCGGLLAFMCKSIDDPLYGKGTPIAEGVFESNHVRHFFSEDYARRCTEDDFEIERIESVRGLLYGQPSAYVKVFARRR